MQSSRRLARGLSRMPQQAMRATKSCQVAVELEGSKQI